jgi:DNA-binding transcriptional ArsR family regulator
MMGFMETGRVLNLRVSGDDAGHVIAAGQTGSGKSETLRQWICQWLLQGTVSTAGVHVWAGDPSGGKSLRKYRRFVDRFTTTPEGCVALLVAAAAEIEARYGLMELDPTEPDQWTGPWLAVAVDEIPQVLRVGGAVALAAVQSIVERGRGARVALGMAMLSPRAELLGKEGAKGQFATRFAHRLADSTEVSLALRPGAVRTLGGRGPCEFKEKGRAFVALDSEPGYPEVQVFRAPEADALITAGVAIRDVWQDRPETDRPRATDRVNSPPYVREAPAGRSVGSGASDDRVLTVLRGLGPKSPREVSAATGMALSTAQVALKRLAAAGKVRQTDDGKWTTTTVSDDNQEDDNMHDNGMHTIEEGREALRLAEPYDDEPEDPSDAEHVEREERLRAKTEQNNREADDDRTAPTMSAETKLDVRVFQRLVNGDQWDPAAVARMIVVPRQDVVDSLWRLHLAGHAVLRNGWWSAAPGGEDDD